MNPSDRQLHFASHAHSGLREGPRLIVLGGVHGNEVCGPAAIRRVLDEIRDDRIAIAAGTVTFVPVANPLACARGTRAGDRNLNRNLVPTDHPRDFEDHVANWLCPLLARHDVLLDLHSTRARNAPFAMLGPLDNAGTLQPFAHSSEERALARHLGVNRFVDGWLETYATGVKRRVERFAAAGMSADTLETDARYGVGTTEYMRSVGGYAITLECGQHEDPASIEVADRAIRNTLAFLGISADAPPRPVADAEWLTLCEVHDRLHADDVFSREWASFDRIAQGDLIGTRAGGSEVRAPVDGYVVFPDKKAEAGREWFYLARRGAPGAHGKMDLFSRTQ